jgi:RHS repeat-associated protein
MGFGIADNNCLQPNAASRTQPQMPIPGSARGNLGYSPYGYHSPFQTLLGFNGDRPDPATGCYPLGNGRRSFSTSLMRFISPDSMSPFAAGGLNPYAYCLGDPLNRQDPSGNSSVFKPLVDLYRRHFPKKHNLPATVYESIPVEYEKHFVSYRDIPNKYNMKIVEQADGVPFDYELIGFHGSQEMYTQSLEAGVDANRLKRTLLGRGLYGSTSYMHANKYAGKDGRIFGVYGRDVERWRAGVQFDRPSPDILLIRPPTFSNIIVRTEIRMPLRLLHPLIGDSF